MKTTKLIIGTIVIAILVLNTSCEKWNLMGIHGEGPVVSENLELSAVQGIILEIPASVYLVQGTEQNIKIEAQQNILDNMERSIVNGILKLSFDRNVSQCEPIKVYMTIENLKNIALSGSGEILSDSKFVSEGNLSIKLSGSGKVELESDANEIDLNISGSGQIKLKTECTRINGEISGSGDIIMSGGSTLQSNFSTSGSGGVYAYNFNAEDCMVNITGSGNSKVNVSKKLSVRITGSGNVYYIGQPTLSVNITGSGNVINSN